ncbi:MAG: DUF1643 domain-containing protein [Flavobacteriia bacterium]|jgi:Uncharacterized protein conserved in bacteria|nr:DUF1643 domain-containing protein [Flavobacteriia bacterium]
MEVFDAILSKDACYRYVLSRIWDNTKPMVNFICLNPSTADEKTDDPTVRRCRSYAQSWRYGGFYMTNLFAFRATNPESLKVQKDPIGDENDKWLKEIAGKSALVVFAWGVNGIFGNRDEVVKKFFPEAYCIALSKDGHPKHPLYLKKDLEPQRYPG